MIIASVVVVGITIHFIKKNRLEKRLISISDAGYETAYNILSPLKSKRLKKVDSIRLNLSVGFPVFAVLPPADLL